MDDELIDKTILKKIHGYRSCSDDDSESDSKVELDEIYEQFKPPPIPIDPTVHKIIEIGPEDDEDYITTKHVLYSSALKRNLKTDQNNACVEVDVDKENKRAKKKKKRKKKKKSGKVLEGSSQYSESVNIVKENVMKEENINNEDVRRNENPKINDNIAYNTLQNSEERNFVQVDDSEVKLSKKQRYRRRKALKKATETCSNTNEKTKCCIEENERKQQEIVNEEKYNTFKKCEDIFITNVIKNEECESDTSVFKIKSKIERNQQNNLKDFQKKDVEEGKNQNQEVVRIRKKKKKSKSNVPSEGCLLSMFDSAPLYQNSYAFGSPNFENFKFFKESFLNGSNQNYNIFEKLSKLLKSYQNHINIFIEKQPADAFRVFVASQVFLKSVHQLDIKMKPLRFNCVLIGKIAAIFSNFAKSQRNLNYRNSDLFKNRVAKFNSEVDAAFESILRIEYHTGENFWEYFDDFSDTVISWINKNLTDMLENFVLRCRNKLNPGEIFNEEAYSAINAVAKYENIFKIFESLEESPCEKENSEQFSIPDLTNCQETENLIDTQLEVQNENLGIVTQNCQNKLSCLVIEDLTENKKYFYNFDLNFRKWQKFQNEYLNNDTSSFFIPTRIDNNQTLSNHLIIDDLTHNRKYFYDFHSKSNVRKWRNFRKTYLNECSTAILTLKSESEVPSTTHFKSPPRTIAFLEYPLLWTQQNFDVHKFFTKLIFLILLKNIIFWLFHYLLVLLITLIFNGIDVFFLILVLLYLCTFFVIKF